VLQHAWAEVEHDRSYKFSGELPSQFRRRFHLVAGLLELADREFSLLTEELERYAAEAHKSVEVGSLDLELNSTTTVELLKFLVAQNDGKPTYDASPADESVMQELRDFGIESLSGLRAIVSKDLLTAISGTPNTTMGLLRDAMIFSDIDRYFRNAWKRRWNGWDADSLTVVQTRYGADRVNGLLQRYGIEVLGPGE
jgi:putative GTP pyrophosphokinase